MPLICCVLQSGGGVTSDGQTVEGLAMDYGTVSEYSTEWPGTGKTGQCGEALQLYQAIQVGLRNDESPFIMHRNGQYL